MEIELRGRGGGGAGLGLELGFDQLGHVHSLTLHFLAAEAGKGQQIVNQPAHPAGFPGHDIQQSVPLRIKPGGVVLLQDAHETVHPAQRGAEIMGDGITEGLKLFVGGLELGGSFNDALLEFGVEPANLIFVLSQFDLRLFPVRDDLGKEDEAADPALWIVPRVYFPPHPFETSVRPMELVLGG